MPTTEVRATRNAEVAMPIVGEPAPIKNPFVIPGLRKLNIDSNLNPNYAFEHFIEGECNCLAERRLCRGQQTWRDGVQSASYIRRGGFGKNTLGACHWVGNQKSPTGQNGALCQLRAIHASIH